MDVLFSLLDGACALWLCLFSPRRYLRIVASTNLTMMGARHFFEIYIKTLLIPAVVLASISGFTAELQENDNVVKLLGTDKVNQFLHSKEYVSITIYFGALLTYYSLARS